MKATKIRNFGIQSELEWTETADVRPNPDEVSIRIHATAVNRADLLQRRGLYPPPEGASEILGLECSGEIIETGRDVNNWEIGDRVCALLAGGGYAEYVTVSYNMLLSVPKNMSFAESACIPEAFYTAYLNLIDIGKLKAGESCIIHSGGSGVGTAAIQLAKMKGATVIATAGTPEKIRKCLELGADEVYNHADEDFMKKIKSNARPGIDLILDTVGAKYLNENINLLSYRGRLILIGLLGGTKSELDLGQVLTKNILIVGSTLRNQSLQEKIILTQKIRSEVMPFFETGQLKVVMDSVWPITKAHEAHQRMSENKNFGKLVLSVV
jgi:putative PIG3 family NAD(P)H quinone oxidoreductase